MRKYGAKNDHVKIEHFKISNDLEVINFITTIFI